MKYCAGWVPKTLLKMIGVNGHLWIPCDFFNCFIFTPDCISQCRIWRQGKPKQTGIVLCKWNAPVAQQRNVWRKLRTASGLIWNTAEFFKTCSTRRFLSCLWGFAVIYALRNSSEVAFGGFWPSPSWQEGMTEFLGKWESEKYMSDQRKYHFNRGLAGPWKSLVENSTSNSWTGELNEASNLETGDGVGLWRWGCFAASPSAPTCHFFPPRIPVGDGPAITWNWKEFIKVQRRNKPAHFLTRLHCTLLVRGSGVPVFAGFMDFHIYYLFCAAGGKNVLQLAISAEDARVWRCLRYSCICRVAAVLLLGY